jgi:hypothetical protein
LISLHSLDRLPGRRANALALAGRHHPDGAPEALKMAEAYRRNGRPGFNFSRINSGSK